MNSKFKINSVYVDSVYVEDRKVIPHSFIYLLVIITIYSIENYVAITAVTDHEVLVSLLTLV